MYGPMLIYKISTCEFQMKSANLTNLINLKLENSNVTIQHFLNSLTILTGFKPNDTMI